MMKDVRQENSLAEILSTIGDLPSSPAVVSLVMGMTSDLNTDVRELSKALSSDPAIAARALRLSNSPFYGRPSDISSVEEAALVLGFFTVRSLVVATATYDLFKSNDASENKGASAGALWEHSLATAIAARQIARRVSHPQIEECFLAGLMHDIGKLIMLQKFPEQCRSLITIAQPNTTTGSRTDTLAEERKAFGFGHDELGAALLTSWSFPELLISAIADHHRRVIPSEGETTPISIIVHLASAVAREIGASFGCAGNDGFSTDNLWSAQALSIDDETLSEIRDTLAENFQQERSLFI